MKLFSKVSILVFSEMLWIYYIIAMLASLELDKIVFVNMIWWGVAAFVGYVFNAIVAGRIHYIILLVGNILLLSSIIFQNIQMIHGETWELTLVLSTAVAFVYIRSASFIFREKEPTRLQMLQHFEGNIIAYIIFSIVFVVNGWSTEFFHAAFLIAISLTLIGMILTLQSSQTGSGEDVVEVQSLGNPGWFTSVMGALLVGVTLLCTLLFLPKIRETLHMLGKNGLQLLKAFGETVAAWIAWLFSFFPSSEIEDPELEMNPPEMLPMEEEGEQLFLSLPIEWLFAIIGVVVVTFLLIVLSKYLKGWKPANRSKLKPKKRIRNSWWSHLKIRLQDYLTKLILKWKATFSRYYKKPIYWHFKQIEKWGRKNRMPRRNSETSREYVERIIRSLDFPENETQATVHLESIPKLLREMNEQYEAAYYGNEETNLAVDDRQLLKLLKTYKLTIGKE